MSKTNSNQKTSATKKLSSQKLSQDKKLSYPQTKTSAIVKDHEYKDKLASALQEAEHTDGIKYKATATSTETKEVFEVPLRATITNTDKDLDITKTSVWVLMTLNNCTVQEVNDFEKKYKDKLTFSEKLSIKLLRDALRGNKEAQRIYWSTMERITNRPKVMNQMNFTQVNTNGNTVMTDLLNQITKNLQQAQTKPQEGEVAQEGQIVAE